MEETKGVSDVHDTSPQLQWAAEQACYDKPTPFPPSV